MFATRCKPRWPAAVTTVGLSSTFLARPTLLAGPQSRRLGTSASSEAGRDEGKGDGSAQFRRMFKPRQAAHKYTPFAYEPMLPVSYADILGRAISTPITDSRRILYRIRRALQHRLQDQSNSSCAEDASVQSEQDPLALHHVLHRSLGYLTTQSTYLQGALSAVTEDISSDTLPDLWPHESAAIHAHHLGRWYAKRLALKDEHGAINYYLNIVTATTKKARNIIISNYLRHIDRLLAVQKRTLRRAIHHHQSELKAAVYTMVCELRAARRARQWHKVWTLERKLAMTASTFLPSHPLTSLGHSLLFKDNERITEISMSRVAEWNDSYPQIYEQDVHAREFMDLGRRYWTVRNHSAHEVPWEGEAVALTVKSPTTNTIELIVIRHDQSMPPSPLWPPGWSPAVLPETNTPAGLNPDGVAHEVKQRIIQTPSQIRWRWISKGQTGKGPREQSQQQPSLSTPANSDVQEA